MTDTTTIPAPGFADPTPDAQRTFRAVLDALAHPGRSYEITGPKESPAALGAGLTALALTVLDEDTSVWLGGALADDAEVAAYLAFHTGVGRATDSASAAFVVVTPAQLPDLDTLALGTDEAPHESATVVLDARGVTGSTTFQAKGPGINGSTVVDASWAPEGFLAQWQKNSSLFPRGVDLLVVTEDSVSALPRTTRLTEMEG